MNKRTPTKLTFVHGTWGRGYDPDRKRNSAAEPRWFEKGSQFRNGLTSRLSDLSSDADSCEFLWSGENSIEERRIASARLAKRLDESVAQAPDTPHFVIAHSHGGNVALNARQEMSESPGNVHIVTMATPFLSIQRGVPRAIDHLLVICLAVGAAAFAGYLWMSWGTGSPLLFFAPIAISVSSLVCGLVAASMWTYGRVLKRHRPRGGRRAGLDLARRINNRTLFTSGIILAALWLRYGRNPEGLLGNSDPSDANFALFSVMVLGSSLLALTILIPSFLVFFLCLQIGEKVLYGPSYESPRLATAFDNLYILRGRGDEATLTLMFGRLVSFVSQIAASIAMVAPVVAVSLAAVLVYLATDLLVSVVRSYSECLATLTPQCLDRQLSALAVSIGVEELTAGAARYAAYGLAVSATLILLAAMCKSLFGRELLYRSLNAVVSVSDTPDGSDLYGIDWCASAGAGLSGLRHSLYNNPEAPKKIAAYVARVCTREATEHGGALNAPPSKGLKRQPWPTVAAFLAVGCIYTLTAAYAYAPSVARSFRCAIRSYLEPSASTGRLTVLVAEFEGDREGIGDRIAEEIGREYGFPVARTCLGVKSVKTEVQDIKSEEGSPAWLLSRYRADLVVWGKLSAGPQVEVHVWQRGAFRDPNIVTRVKSSEISTFVASQLRSDLAHAVEYWSVEAPETGPPAALADLADKAEALARRLDRDSGLSGDPLHDFRAARDAIKMHAAAGRAMRKAAAASGHGDRARKAVVHFGLATDAWDRSGDDKHVIPNDWKGDEAMAWLLDARLNGNEWSAKRAASRYLAGYEDARKNFNVPGYAVASRAEEAAVAASEVHAITRDEDAAKSSIRLSCASLWQLRRWRETEKEIRRRNAALAQQGRLGAILPDLPSPEQSEAFRILVRAGRNPSSILSSGREMKLADCETF